MERLFQLGAKTNCLVLLFIRFATLAQSDDASSDQYTMMQSASYFFYKQPEHPKDCTDALNYCLNVSGVTLIKPTGYMDPFEVYCESDLTSSGWTVIHRRLDGSLSFNRDWTEYKNGFGFLNYEFWLGSEKVSHLTNQGVYELRVSMELSNGSYFYISYNYFRISDEWSQYAFVSMGSYHESTDLAITYCPLNMVYGHCECQPTCNFPKNTTRCISSCDATESCICADGFLTKGVDCVLPNECGCYAPELHREILNGDSFVNFDCSEKCTCNDGQLYCDSTFECSHNATCKIENGMRNCYCNEGYQGNGEICDPLPTDCYDAHEAGHRDDGVYTILPSGWPDSPFKVSCVMSTNGGGWTVFQRRTDGVTDFYQNWKSYRYGFGSPEGDFWLGNEHLHYLTNQKNYTLRIDIVTSEGASEYDVYASFRISNESNKFRIDDIGTHNGTAGNGMYNSGGNLFSTHDQDNDGCGNHHCAEVHRGAWWYANDWCSKCLNRHCHNFRYNSTCSGQCTGSNLNGEYNGRNGENIFWANDYSYCNLIFAEMKIRPF